MAVDYARTSGYATVDWFEREVLKPAPGRALIVGSKLYNGRPDRRKAFAEAVGIDMLPGDGVDIVANMEGWLAPELGLGTFKHVECMSVLEHSRRPWALASNIESLLDPGGTLYFGMPFMWRVHSYPDDYWRLTVEGVRLIFPRIEWSHLDFATDKVYGADMRAQGRPSADGPLFPRCQILGFGRRK